LFCNRRQNPGIFHYTMIRILAQKLTESEISPYQCGQFVEFIANLVRTMHAEKVFDNSFLGLEPYLGWFIKHTDFKENPWYPSGAVHRGEYALDEENPFNGPVSQKIATIGSDPCDLGISQDGIFVEEGKQYALSCYLRRQGISGPVRARIARGNEVLASCEFSDVGGDWSKYSATLTSSGTDAQATLRFEFRGPGTLWLDKVSLMPVDNVHGWRPDVIEAVRVMKPGMIRFGGTAVRKYYEWENGIGDVDHRVPFSSPAAGGLEPNNVGMNEFIAFCRAVDAEPLICVRFTTKTPEDAAHQVEYCNGSIDTPYGKRRAENGHPEPYGVRFWQVGNEVISEEYDRTLIDFCRAMRTADPTIKLLSSYPTTGLLESAGELIDYTCPHPYDAEDIEAKEEEVAKFTAIVAEHAPGCDIKLAYTEWNAYNPGWGTGRGRLWTLDNALKCARFHNFMHRHADQIKIAIRSNLADSFCGGAIQTDNARLFKTPVYYAQSLYGNHAGAYPLKVESAGPLDISATLSRDGKQMTLFVVNDTTDLVSEQIDIGPVGEPEGPVQAWIMGDTQRENMHDVSNSFDEPERISTERSTMECTSNRIVFEFQPLTLTVLQFKLLEP
jgi:alpha-N-arabinofuranosidase